jgi:hypothetical protein
VSSVLATAAEAESQILNSAGITRLLNENQYTQGLNTDARQEIVSLYELLTVENKRAFVTYIGGLASEVRETGGRVLKKIQALNEAQNTATAGLANNFMRSLGSSSSAAAAPGAAAPATAAPAAAAASGAAQNQNRPSNIPRVGNTMMFNCGAIPSTPGRIGVGCERRSGGRFKKTQKRSKRRTIRK